MGLQYDAEEVAAFIDAWNHIHSNFKLNADILEEQYVRYSTNETYVGLAAEASKRFINEKQMKFHYDNIDIQKELLNRYLTIEKDFKSMVDPSKEARIDTDVIKEDSDHFKSKFDDLYSDAEEINKISRYVIEKFGKYNSNITKTSYRRSLNSYEEEAEFCDKCIKKMEEFDELSLEAVQNSGLLDFIYDYQSDIKATTAALKMMKAYEPKMDKTEINLLSLGGAPKAIKTLSTPNSANSVQLMQLNALVSGTVAMDKSLNDILVSEEVFNPLMVGTVEQCIKQFFLEAGCLLGEVKEGITVALPEMIASSLADGTLPIGEVIALGILVVTIYMIHQKNKADKEVANSSGEAQEVEGKEKAESEISAASGGNSGDDDDDDDLNQYDTKERIDNAKKIAREVQDNNGTPPKGYQGGRTYNNTPKNPGDQKLPEGHSYKEYDVNPKQPGVNRGAERIVIGDDGSVWYTNDHYHTFFQLR